MRQLGVDNDLIGWIQFFLTDRKVEIVIDGHIVEKQKLERLTQAQHGHRSFWLLLYYHLLISCTCTLVGGTSAQGVHLL